MSLRDKLLAAQQGQTAQDTFSDRREERDAFEMSLISYRESISQLGNGKWRAQDLQRPRRNVLSFYGVGGVGKSSLLRKLERTIGPNRQSPKHWPEVRVEFEKLIPATIDLGRNGVSGIEPILVALRAALMESGVSTPAFDIFLAAYWAEVHPNETLKDRVASSSRLGRLTERLGLESHIQGVIGDIGSVLLGSGAVGTSTYSVVKQLISFAKSNKLRKEVFADCELLNEIIAEVDDSAALELSAHLLAWDIERVQIDKPLGLVVFLDTIEEADDRVLEGIEQVLWLLPNVLFVIAGRNRVPWSERSSLPVLLPGASGEWPGLAKNAQAEPRQHLVGNLSKHDSRTFLVSCLPDAPNEILSAIESSSDGFPLQLDLAVQRYRQLKSRGEVAPEDFQISFEQLANRVVRDLSSQEQLALMACCLFDSFDESLVQIAAGLEVVGPVRELFKRSLLESGSDTIYGNSLHNVLRQALLNSADMGMGQLSHSDWQLFAERGVAELVRREALSGKAERRFIVSQIAGIAMAFDVGMDAFETVSGRVLIFEEWHPTLRVGLLPNLLQVAVDNTKLHHAIIRATFIVVTRQERPRAEVVSDLKEILAGHDDASDLDFARYCLGESLRDIGEIDASETVMSEVAKGDGVWAKRAIRGQIHLYRRAGRFKTIQRILSSDEAGIPHRGRLLGDLYWTQCQLSRAYDHYFSEAVLARSEGNASEEALNIASMCFVRSWLHPSELGGLKQKVEKALDGASSSFTQLLVMTSDVLASSGVQESLETYHELMRVAASVESTSAMAYGELALAFQGMINGSPAIVEEAYGRVVERSDGIQFVYIAWIISQWLPRETAAAGPDLEQQEWCSSSVLDLWRELPRLRVESVGTGLVDGTDCG